MKALTLWQPWASLLVAGVKGIETRAWRTAHRGPLAIHAAIRPANPSARAIAQALLDQPLVATAVRAAGLPDRLEDYPVGVVVGQVCLQGVMPVEDLVLTPLERALGDFSAGRFGWVMAPPNTRQRYELQPPVRGLPGIWEWEPRP